MALSVLSIENGPSGLWCSKEKKFLVTGNDNDMFTLKDCIERAEQEQDNKEHFSKLKEEYMGILKGLGYKEEEAEAFLKKKMGFLF